MANIGIITDLYPKARPKITLVATPVLQESATSCTGLQSESRISKVRKNTSSKLAVQWKRSKDNIILSQPVCIAGEVLGDKTNNKPSPETNSNTQEQLPVKIKDTCHSLPGWIRAQVALVAAQWL